MKILTLLLLLSTLSYSQKKWDIVEKEKKTVLFYKIHNDTVDVKILLKDKLVEAQRISKVLKRLSNDNYGELFYKTIGYLYEGNLYTYNEILYEKEIIYDNSSLNLYNFQQGEITPSILPTDIIIQN